MWAGSTDMPTIPPRKHSAMCSTPAPRATAHALACRTLFKYSLGGGSSGVSLPGGRTGNCMYSCRLTCTLPTGIASSRLSLPSQTVMTRSVCRFERRTGNTNALPFPFDGQDGLALLYTIPVTACTGGSRQGKGGMRGQVRTELMRAPLAPGGHGKKDSAHSRPCIPSGKSHTPQHPPCATGKPRQTCATYRTGPRAGLPRHRAPFQSISPRTAASTQTHRRHRPRPWPLIPEIPRQGSACCCWTRARRSVLG